MSEEQVTLLLATARMVRNTIGDILADDRLDKVAQVRFVAATAVPGAPSLANVSRVLGDFIAFLEGFK